MKKICLCACALLGLMACNGITVVQTDNSSPYRTAGDKSKGITCTDRYVCLGLHRFYIYAKNGNSVVINPDLSFPESFTKVFPVVYGVKRPEYGSLLIYTNSSAINYEHRMLIEKKKEEGGLDLKVHNYLEKAGDCYFKVKLDQLSKVVGDNGGGSDEVTIYEERD